MLIRHQAKRSLGKCGIKPEKQTDSDYVKKIRDDLTKAKLLHQSGKYVVERWTFITPRKLSNDVVATLRKTAADYGIVGGHQEATYLATAFGDHHALLEQFPNLYAPTIDRKLDDIKNLLVERLLSQEQDNEQIGHDDLGGADIENTQEYDKVMSLRQGEPTKNTKAALKNIYYVSADQVVRINAILGVLELHDPFTDNVDDMGTSKNW